MLFLFWEFDGRKAKETVRIFKTRADRQAAFLVRYKNYLREDTQNEWVAILEGSEDSEVEIGKHIDVWFEERMFSNPAFINALPNGELAEFRGGQVVAGYKFTDGSSGEVSIDVLKAMKHVFIPAGGDLEEAIKSDMTPGLIKASPYCGFHAVGEPPVEIMVDKIAELEGELKRLRKIQGETYNFAIDELFKVHAVYDSPIVNRAAHARNFMGGLLPRLEKINFTEEEIKHMKGQYDYEKSDDQ